MIDYGTCCFSDKTSFALVWKFYTTFRWRCVLLPIAVPGVHTEIVCAAVDGVGVELTPGDAEETS